MLLATYGTVLDRQYIIRALSTEPSRSEAAIPKAVGIFIYCTFQPDHLICWLYRQPDPELRLLVIPII